MTSLRNIIGPSWKKISILVSILFFIFIGFLVVIVQDLAALKNLEQVKPALSTQVYSRDGALIHQYFTHNRVYVDYSQLPSSLIEATIATEDAKF